MQEQFIGFETGDPDSPDVIAVRSDKIEKLQHNGGVYNVEPTTIVHCGEDEPIIANGAIARVIERVNAALTGQPEPSPKQVAIGRRQP